MVRVLGVLAIASSIATIDFPFRTCFETMVI